MAIVIISFSDLYRDPRVNRQIRCLKEKNTIIELGLKPSGYPDTEFIQLKKSKPKLTSRLFLSMLSLTRCYQWREQYALKLNSYQDTIEPLRKREDIELIIANDIESLPLAMTLKGSSKIIVDAHEYSPEQFSDRILWNLFTKGHMHYLCKTYLPKVDSMLTVNDSIAKEYKKNYGVKPTVITNATEYLPLSPSKVDNNLIKMIYHGGANVSRSIDEMIKVMDYTDSRFTLDLMLVWGKPNKNKEKIQQMAADRENVKIVEPVKREEIALFTNQYDIGLYLLKPNNFNQKYALPNKFFEYIQARLALAIGPSPEMANYVKKYDLGIVSEDFNPRTIAQNLNNLTSDEIEHYKVNSNNAAQMLSSRRSEEQLISITNALLSH